MTHQVKLLGSVLAFGILTINTYAQTATEASPKPQLIFQSGFEGSTKVVHEPNTNDHGALKEHIEGIDPTFKSNNNWDKDWSVLNGGHIEVQYTGGDSTKRYGKIVPEPGNPKNHVLKFWLDSSWTADGGVKKARVQTNIYGITSGFKEMYQSVRVFLTKDFEVVKTYPKNIPWCTISEFWNNEWWVAKEPYGFRVTLGIGKPSAKTSDLNFILNGENPGQKEVWNGENVNVKVPIGEWFTMEYYFKEGNEQTGRFWMAITPQSGKKQVVFDIHNFTHMTKDPAPNGLTGFNPMKLYTSKELVSFVRSKGKTLQIYWDDYKLWENKRP